MWCAPVAVAVALASGGAAAQETSLLAGSLGNHKVDERSFAVQLSFAQRMNAVATVSAEYLSEGHPSRHHRDGLAGQGWLHTPARDTCSWFGVGLGPYYYFDTTVGQGALQEYQNDHGWGVLARVSARWQLSGSSYLEARLNHVYAAGAGNSNSVLVGLGYELKNVPERERRRTERAGDGLLMVLSGQAIVNSFAPERSHS